MLLLRTVVLICSAGVSALAAPIAAGQSYPNKSIRFITAESGGGTDFITRLIAREISGPLGQNVIVDNRGTGLIAELVSRAPSDGYTLGLGGASTWISPLMQKTTYDADRDLAWISMVARQPLIVAVHPSVPVKSVKELIALAKAKPGTLNYSSSPAGNSNHIAGELLKTMAGIDIVRIPYKGGGPALNALIAGEVQLSFPSTGAVAPFMKSGKLTPLAVTSPEPSALAPGLPTVAASGYPGYDAGSYLIAFAPGKTPATIIRRLNQEIVRALHLAEVNEKLLSTGFEVVGNSPQQLAAYVKSDMARMRKLIKDAGIKAD